ncbi:MAG: iron complex outerrane recepter protein [Hydrocarboniphaga sp.]|nr:iron complex outerrane recepter protein [Hydrocarboniphaga sp.]
MLAAPAVSVADTDSAPTQLDPVVVTATGNPTPLTEVLAPLLVITREQIEQAQAGDLAELLRFFAGVELGRNGGPGSTTSVFIRGGESNHTLILIDGVRVNPATSGGAALQNIAPDSIERIEVVKGPRATLYGSDAIGGVVNVITRSGGLGTTLGASLRGGSDDTVDGSVRAGYAGERSSASLQVQHEDTDGFPALRGFDQDTGYQRTSVNADGSLKIGEATIGARLWDARGDVEYYGYDANFDRAVVSQDYRNQVAAIDATLPLNDRLGATVKVSRMQDSVEQNQSDDEVETIRSGADAGLVWTLPNQRITGGAGFVHERVSALSFGSAIAEGRDVGTLHLQDELHYGRHRAVVGGSFSDYEGFGSRFDGTLDYGFDLSDATRLVASAATGFRAPDATDRYGFGGNPDLKPEKARNYELGLQQRLGAYQRADLRVFRSDVEDLINTICDENFNCTAVNVDQYRNTGVEISYHLNWDHWSATLTGLTQDPEDRATGEQLLRRAKNSAALKLSRSLGIYNAGIDVLGSGPRKDFGGVELGGYMLIDLTGGVRLGEHVALRLRVENLLDKDYQTAAGYNQQDRSYYATASYAY